MPTGYDERGVECGVFSAGQDEQGKTAPCPGCGDTDPRHRELRNYSMMWHDGDVHCTECGAYVRLYDAG